MSFLTEPTDAEMMAADLANSVANIGARMREEVGFEDALAANIGELCEAQRMMGNILFRLRERHKMEAAE